MPPPPAVICVGAVPCCAPGLVIKIELTQSPPTSTPCCSSYDLKSFRNDLKEVLRRVGVEGKPTLFFMGGSWLVFHGRTLRLECRALTWVGCVSGAPLPAEASVPHINATTAEDHQVVQGTFLELLNSLLSGGEVPGLFTPEELAKVGG